MTLDQLTELARAATPGKICKYHGCEKKHRACGYCSMHYTRMKRCKPLDRSKWELSFEERFWAKVDKTRECWIWRGSHDKNSYGQFCFKYKNRHAHRVAYELLVGQIPDGLHLDHLCRTPACVNPKHLEAVTPKINTLRGISPVAKNAVKTHCLNGHRLTPDNLYNDAYGRRCKVCARARWRKSYWKNHKGPVRGPRIKSEALAKLGAIP